jgi:hypothetical protein
VCDDKVKTIRRFAKDETGRHSTVEENPLIKINNNVINRHGNDEV